MSDSNSLIDTLKALETEALAAIRAAADADTLEELRIAYMGRKEGRISSILRGLGALDVSERQYHSVRKVCTHSLHLPACI